MSFLRDWQCNVCGTVSPDVPTSVPDQYCPYCGILMDKIYTPPLVIFKGEWTPKFHGGKEKLNGERTD